jgi:hypothetical protein
MGKDISLTIITNHKGNVGTRSNNCIDQANTLPPSTATLAGSEDCRSQTNSTYSEPATIHRDENDDHHRICLTKQPTTPNPRSNPPMPRSGPPRPTITHTTVVVHGAHPSPHRTTDALSVVARSQIPTATTKILPEPTNTCEGEESPAPTFIGMHGGFVGNPSGDSDATMGGEMGSLVAAARISLVSPVEGDKGGFGRSTSWASRSG